MTPDADRLGLRERKKLKTRVTLRKVAYELFAEQGYDNTTVTEIAAAAEVSPATFFRYFATKEALVIEDDYDALFLAEMGPIDGSGNVAAQILRLGAKLFVDLDEETRTTELERARLLQSSANLRAAQALSFERTAEQLVDALTEHIDGPVDDVALRVVVGAMIGAVDQVSRTGAPMGPETLLMLAEMFERGLPVTGKASSTPLAE